MSRIDCFAICPPSVYWGQTPSDVKLRLHNHPPLIVYDEDKRLYYEYLQKYDETEELNPLYEFFKYETEKTWERALAIANGVKQKRKGLSDIT